MARIYQDDTRGSADTDRARRFPLLSAALCAQLPWIAYAVVTGQLGFIAGCVSSGAVQTRNFLEESGIRHVVGVERVRGW